MGDRPKHTKISALLREQIAAGKFSDGRRMPSEMELARRLGVSRPTVARAIRDLEKQNLVVRKIGSGTYLKSASSQTSAGDEIVVGLLVPGLGNTEILDPICNEITRYGQANGFQVLWGDSSACPTSVEDAERICEQYIDRKVDGVFFAPLERVADREATNTRITSRLLEAGVQVVLLDRDVPEFPARSNFDLVGIDNFHAGFVLTQHLVSIGHKRLLFVARQQFPATTDLRLAGCREAAAVGGLKLPATAFGDPEDSEFVGSFLELEKPDVIICSNDRTAALLIQSMLTSGIRVPQDIAVVGFDDVRYATLLSVPLTTVRQPCREIGRVCVRVMQERIEAPMMPARQILLPVQLVVRQSCGGKLTRSMASAQQF